MLVHYWKELAVFFLQGVIEESQNHIAMSKRIISLYDEIKKYSGEQINMEL